MVKTNTYNVSQNQHNAKQTSCAYGVPALLGVFQTDADHWTSDRPTKLKTESYTTEFLGNEVLKSLFVCIRSTK